MKELVIHLTVTDEDLTALTDSLENLVDEGDWTLVCLGMPEEGMGGTIPHRHSVRVEAFGVG